MIVDARDYRAVRRAAREFSADLDKEIKKALKDCGKVGVLAVRAKIAAVSPHPRPRGRHGSSRRRRGLRKQLSSNTRTQVRSQDVRIVQGAVGIRGKNARGLPRRLNGKGQGIFKHPVFGNYENLVEQQPWHHFDRPLEAKQDRMVQLMQYALDRAVDRIHVG